MGRGAVVVAGAIVVGAGTMAGAARLVKLRRMRGGGRGGCGSLLTRPLRAVMRYSGKTVPLCGGALGAK